jgi:hypothetical protein
MAANAGVTTGEYFAAAETGTSLNPFHVLSTYDWSFNDYMGATADDQDLTQASGVFFQEAGSSGYRSTIDGMRDGQSHTVVFTENLQSTLWSGYKLDASLGHIADVNRIAYMVAVANVPSSPQQIQSNQSFPNGLGPDPLVPPIKSEGMDYNFMGLNFGTAGGLADAKINNGVGTAGEGLRPRPSSLHPSLVNVCLGDGGVRTVSQSIADSVWYRLTTQSGQRFGENILGENEF